MNTFPRTAFRVAGGLLAWLACFVVVYVVEAVATARGFADMRIGGLRMVTMATVAAFIAAAGINTLLLRRALLDLGSSPDSHSRFLAFVAFATSLIGLIALVLLAVPLIV